MKKLMFAALVVASCSAMADELVNSKVYDLTFAKKSLEFATKAQTIDLAKLGASNWDEAKELAEAQYKKIVEEIEGYCAKECPELKTAIPSFEEIWPGNGSGPVKGKIKFMAPSVKNGVPATKVISTKINGVAIDKGADGWTTYLFDNAKNEYKKFWAAKYTDEFDYNGFATKDGKATMNVTFEDEGYTMGGVATGTADKNSGEFKSVAGNFADLASRGYGTWKFAYNKKLTGKTDGEILAAKKAEIFE